MSNRKAKILCVEDEQDIRENIAEILRDEGFEVFEAVDGKKGYESFIQNKPDLIISDIMMPNIDGYGLLKMIRDNSNTRKNNIPFIFLTALGQRDDVVKGVNLSANDYLVKPIDFELMIAKVKEKTDNALKLESQHKSNMKNLKNQVSLILGKDVTSYLNIITNAAMILRDEPYGPLPHRKYKEDFEKIYNNALKLRAAIENSLDETVIDNSLNANEEVFDIHKFLKEFIAGLSPKYRERIEVEIVSNQDDFPNIKCDKIVLHDALKKILSSFFKLDLDSNISIRIMFDHTDQMVIIFRVDSKIGNLGFATKVDESAIARILDQQNCRFEIVDTQDNTAVLIIPSYRIINS